MKILVIEDDSIYAQLVRKSLTEELGPTARILIAPNLQEGITVCQEQAPSVALLDLTLPDRCGLETLQVFRAANPGTPLVVLTNLKQTPIARDAIRGGAQDYLFKFDLDFSRDGRGRLARSLDYAIARFQAEEEMRRAYAETEATRRENAALLEATRQINSSLDLTTTLQSILERVAELTESNAGGIALAITPDELQYAAAYGDSSFPGEGQVVVRGRGLAGIAAQTGELVRMTDCLDDERVFKRPEMLDAGIRAGLIVPLFQNGLVIGTLSLFSPEVAHYTDTHIRLVEGVADQAALAIERAREIRRREDAEHALQESNQKLEQAFLDLQRTQEQLMQNERLRALGQMASGVAHDFNNSLAQVIGFLDLIQLLPSLGNGESALREYVDYASAAAQDAAKVVRRLRDFYRSSDVKDRYVPLDLNEQVREMVAMTQIHWRNQASLQGVSIQIEEDLGELAPALGNVAELREVLTNLILNAVDAIHERGTICFRTRLSESHVVLEVSDDGVGMTEEVRHRCFEPFFSTKGPSGTGLGLSMAYGIVQRHHGTIQVESQVGQGTTVRIRLPASVAAEPLAPLELAEPRKLAGLKVLLVEDEAPLALLIARLLQADGHRVETAVDGQDGLDKFLQGDFQLVLTDRAMPRLNGDQLARAIKSAAPTTPVILLSGFGDLMLANDERPFGIDLVLGKPANAADLRRAIATVLRPD